MDVTAQVKMKNAERIAFAFIHFLFLLIDGKREMWHSVTSVAFSPTLKMCVDVYFCCQGQQRTICNWLYLFSQENLVFRPLCVP